MIPKPLITYIETAIIPVTRSLTSTQPLTRPHRHQESLALARQYPEADGERLAYVIAAYQ